MLFTAAAAGTGKFYPPTALLFGITGGLLGWATLLWPITWVQKLFLGSDYDKFEDYYNTDQGYDNRKGGLLLFKVFFILALITMPFTFGTRLVLGDSSITKRKLTDISAATYSYKDVQRIVRYEKSQDRKGQLMDNVHYVLYFNDNTNMNLNFYFGDGEDADIFIKDLSSHSGLEITNIEVEPF